MRRSLLLLFLLAGCASQRPPLRHGPPPAFGDRSGPRGGPYAGPDREARYLFISPMGEPFRMAHPDQVWFAGADTNHDGKLDRAEFRADAARFFKLLDRGGDGEIDPDDIAYYETELVPEVRVGGGPGGGGSPSGRRPGGGQGGHRGGGGMGGGGMGGGRGPGGGGHGGPPGSDGAAWSGAGPGGGEGRQGAARYGYLDSPEPITAADRNFNRGIDPREFADAADERFALLDRNGDGVITPGELPSIDTRLRGRGPGGRGRGHRPPGGGRGFGGRPPRDDGDAPTG